MIPEKIAYKLEKDISFDDAALIEPASVAYHSISISKLRSNETVIVIGTGVIGLIIIQGLKIKGCKKIVAIDIDDKRLEIAKYYGADIIINSKNNDAITDFMEHNLDKIDLAFEAVGISETIEIALSAVKKKGKVILVGNVSKSINLSLQKVVTKELEIYGSCAIADEYPMVIKHLSEKKLNFDKIITAKPPLSKGNNYFKILSEGNSNHIKIILKP